MDDKEILETSKQLGLSPELLKDGSFCEFSTCKTIGKYMTNDKQKYDHGTVAGLCFIGAGVIMVIAVLAQLLGLTDLIK